MGNGVPTGKSGDPQHVESSRVAGGHIDCHVERCRRRCPAPAGRRMWTVRGAMIGWMVVAALLLGLSIGRAADRGETTMTVQVSSADHETEEGYFSLGKDATLLAKPGTDLHQFLAGQNGKQV